MRRISDNLELSKAHINYYFLVYLSIDLLYFFLGFLLDKCHHMLDLQYKDSEVFTSKRVIVLKTSSLYITTELKERY